MNKAIFIDKDGTLIPDLPYNANPNLILLEKNSAEGLRRLQDQGYLLIVISNQAGVAKGFFEERQLIKVAQRLKQLLNEQQIRLDGFYYCPHHPDGTVKEYAMNCICRKPGTGMILNAAKEWNIDLNASWMIGDILNDVEAGNTSGCKTILIDNGNETEWVMNARREPDYIAKTINQAAEYLLEKRLA